MGWFIIVVIVAVIGLFVWAHFKNKADEERLLEENPGALYPFFGVFTSRCIYTTSTFEKDVILVNSDTGKIYIGGKTYEMADITQCGTMVHDGHMETTYEDKTYIKTNTGSAIGRAVVGGAIAGGVGAIVGASTANREIKTKRVAQHTYIGKSNSLYLELNNIPQMVNVHAKSEDELWDVAYFINNEITDYNAKRKKGQEELDKEKKKKEEEENKKIEEERLEKTKKDVAKFVQSPLEFSVEQIANIDPNRIRNGRDSLFLSQYFRNLFAEAIGINGLRLFIYGSSEIEISTETLSYQDAINNFVNLKKFLINMFGTPQKDKNIETIESEIINKKMVTINWNNDWNCCMLLLYIDSSNKYCCDIKMKK